MLGERLSHYDILEQLAAGGMGVVYRARDRRIGREVALKVLPPSILNDPAARALFMREALALSRLNHPAIATLYEFDHADEVDFLAMEYVVGHTLEDLLKDGPLEERDTLALAAQIADALQAAHEQGVVHRDLKPMNVMVTQRGQVKVLDFGVARLGGAPNPTQVPTAPVRTPALAGTPIYMAPEQLLGNEADARSDLHALGTVLFRMSTGQLPFESSNTNTMVTGILHSPAPPPSGLRPGMTLALESLILRCLEKDPERRPASAGEVAAELRRIAEGESRRAPAGGVAVQSVAVLPLENLSGDPGQEFFADGMTEALIANLAQIGALRVISRTSVMQYKGARRPLPQIARELRVDAVVEGSVLRVGNRVRITAQLIEAASDRHLWARSYERDMGDVLGLQAEVARAIADEVRVKLSPREQARLSGPRPVNARAYEAYLRGRFYWNKRTPADLHKSIEFFRQAVEADPDYAVAYSGLADAYNILGDINAIPNAEAGAQAKAAVQHALELDPQLAEAYTSLGFMRTFYDWEWAAADSAFRQSLALNPNYATGHQWYAEFLASQGRVEESLREARKALELDPFSLIMGTSYADTFYFARRYDEAIAQLRRTLELEPRFVMAHSDLARVLCQAGRLDEAIAEFLEAARLSGFDPDLSAGLGYAYGFSGRSDDARRVLGRVLERSKTANLSLFAVASIHLGLGELQEALAWLERAHAQRDRALAWLKVHPRVDPLRAEPRFQALLVKMRLG